MTIDNLTLVKRSFFGEEIFGITSKGRIVVPAKFVDVLRARNKEAIESLQLELIDSRIKVYDPWYLAERKVKVNFRDLKLAHYDSQDRITIPKQVRDSVDLGSRVILYASMDGEYFCIEKAR